MDPSRNQPIPSHRVATCRTVLKFDRVPLPLTIFVLIGRAEAFNQAEVGFDLRTEDRFPGNYRS